MKTGGWEPHPVGSQLLQLVAHELDGAELRLADARDVGFTRSFVKVLVRAGVLERLGPGLHEARAPPRSHSTIVAEDDVVTI